MDNLSLYLTEDSRWRNRKNGHIYSVIWPITVINATNSDNGTVMVVYASEDDAYVRERNEFFEKFEPVTNEEMP